MSDSENEDLPVKEVKITVIGDPGTGKSTLCARYLGLLGSTEPTQGAEMLFGQCLCFKTPINVCFCDVSGNSLSSSMLQSYLYDSKILIYVYDLTNLQSFQHLIEWLVRIRAIYGDETKKPFEALFGNKSDMEHYRAVQHDNVQAFASEHLLTNFNGSALTGDMVETTVSRLIAESLGLHYMKPSRTMNAESNGSSHQPSNGQGSSRNGAQSQLILNRKTMREIKRKGTSNVCCLQ